MKKIFPVIIVLISLSLVGIIVIQINWFKNQLLIQQERFTGLLVPVFASSLDKHTLAGFHAMNAALKARAEAPVAAPSEALAVA